MRRTFVLAILDGWGIGKLDESNPIYIAQPKTINYIERNFPAASLQASGIAVGLPWDEEGNSEVGHLTIGAGKTLYQHYPRISLAIEDESFFKNEVLVNAFKHARENNSAVHLLGLLCSGNVHASFTHLSALLEMGRRENCPRLYLQLFADGKDSRPRSVEDLFRRLNEIIKNKGVGAVASLSGRYYALDRDDRWERTEKTYRVLVGEKTESTTVEETAKKAYKEELSDEYIEPTIIGEPHPIQSKDSLIFFDFREDSMRQISRVFLDKNFNRFPAKKFEDLYIATFTEYEEEFHTNIAFPRETIKSPLGKVLSENGKLQLRIAETEKYAHVTYFFNGLREPPYENEYRVLIPSLKVLHHEERPEMMASTTTDRVLVALNEGGFDFILINYANPDIIAHTGNFEGTLKAIKVVDEQVGRLIKAVMDHNHVLVITADHGNAEGLINLKTGEPETAHDPNPVPFYLVAKELQKPPDNEKRFGALPTIGMLADVAPTILEMMRIPKPPEMTGQSLLDQML